MTIGKECLECRLWSYSQARPAFPQQIWGGCEQVLACPPGQVCGVPLTAKIHVQRMQQEQWVCRWAVGNGFQESILGCRLGNGPDGNVTRRNSVQQKQVLFLPESCEFPGAKLQFLDQELTRGRQDIHSRRKQRTKQLDPGSNSDPRKEAGWGDFQSNFRRSLLVLWQLA